MKITPDRHSPRLIPNNCHLPYPQCFVDPHWFQCGSGSSI